jgi:hypothetical protein
MNSSERRKIMSIVLAANNELIDLKLKISTINTEVKPMLRKLKLLTALDEVLGVEKELKERTEKLRIFISSRIKFHLLEGRIFGDLIEREGRLVAKKRTLTTSPIDYFSCNDLNRGFIVLHQVNYDRVQRITTGSTLLKFHIRSGLIENVSIFDINNIDMLETLSQQLEDCSFS